MWDAIRVFFDIFIVSIIIYRILVLMVETRAVQLVKGFLLLGVLGLLASSLDLRLLSWFLSRILWALVFAIPIVFQPELRKMLDEIGRGYLWHRRMDQEEAEKLSGEIMGALTYMKSQKIGALLVLQRETGLKDYWTTGVKLEAQISKELIISVFWKNNPLHDGAMILDRDGILAAACYLPLTDNSEISRWYGTRHRAALGITEVSDASVLVVSEQRGQVALAYNGHLSKNLNEAQLQKYLSFYFSGTRETTAKNLKDRLLNLLRPLWSK
ncbi:MAG: diadenylate cyclase CdaA [Synergistaceae bacterium]|jgi:diadenylate cyclase|nr:diadenylate cyclase CdaA [Synergistaceae bacterium]